MTVRIQSKCFKTSLFALLVMAGLSACEQADEPSPSGELVRIAYVNFVDYEQQTQKDDMLEGILLANAADPWLKNGDRLEIVAGKRSDTVNSYMNTVEGYLGEGAISGLLVGADSRHLLQEKETLNALGIPSLAIVATHPDVTAKADFISQLSFDDNRQGQAAAVFARDELLVKRVAVFFEIQDPYSSNLGQVFRTRFEQTGGLITDFRPIDDVSESTLEDLREKNTEFLYLPVSANHVLEMVAKLETMGWSPILMGSDGLLASVQQKYPDRGYKLNGMYVTDLFTDIDDSDYRPGFVQRVLGRIEDINSTSSDTALGIEAYRIMQDALEECPDRNSAVCVNRSLRSGRPRQGIMSRVSIHSNGKAKRPVYINRLHNNMFKLVVKVN